MIKVVRESILDEGYGAGFSLSRGPVGRGRAGLNSFGGANNMGGPNMMYTYEIKPLNHTLEQRPVTDTPSFVEDIKLGSKISGCPVRSNAYPDGKKKIKGIVQSIVKSDEGAIKYYVVIDQASQIQVKIEPLTASLVVHDPIEYYNDMRDVESKRRQKIEAAKQNKKVVRESIS